MNTATSTSLAPPVNTHGANHTVTPLIQHHAQLVKQAQKWVAQTFYGTLLKQMRDSPLAKNDMFNGGRGGQAFNAMFDQQLAGHMAGGSGSKLVNAIVRKMEGREAYRRATAKPAVHFPRTLQETA